MQYLHHEVELIMPAYCSNAFYEEGRFSAQSNIAQPDFKDNR
jgi:hypothetical protein